jgi:Flp pilus assembly pilin Flp
MILIGILALILILIISGVSAELTETFSNPNWMNKEEEL